MHEVHPYPLSRAESLDQPVKFNDALSVAVENLGGRVPTPDQYDHLVNLASGLHQADGQFTGADEAVLDQEAARTVAAAARPDRWLLDGDQSASLYDIAKARRLRDLPEDVRRAGGKRQWDLDFLDQSRREAQARLVLHDKIQADMVARDAAAMQTERERVYQAAYDAAMLSPDRITELVDDHLARSPQLGPNAEAMLRANLYSRFETEAGAVARSRAEAAADDRVAYVAARGGIRQLEKINFQDRTGVTPLIPTETADRGFRIIDRREHAPARPSEIPFSRWLHATAAERQALVAQVEQSADLDPGQPPEHVGDWKADMDGAFALAEQNVDHLVDIAYGENEQAADAAYIHIDKTLAEEDEDADSQAEVEILTPQSLRDRVRARFAQLRHGAHEYFQDPQHGRRRRVSASVGTLALGAVAGYLTYLGVSSGAEHVIPVIGQMLPSPSLRPPAPSTHEVPQVTQTLRLTSGDSPWDAARQALSLQGLKHPTRAQIYTEDAHMGRQYMASNHLGKFSWRRWLQIARRLPVGTRLRRSGGL